MLNYSLVVLGTGEMERPTRGGFDCGNLRDEVHDSHENLSNE